MTAHPPKIAAPATTKAEPAARDAPVILLGGRRVAPEEAVVSVFDGGFALGDGLFETMLAMDGLIFGEDAHLARLTHSAAALGLHVPARDLLVAELHEAVGALGGREGDEIVVRLQVTSGAPGRGPTRVVTARRLTERELARRSGLALHSVGPGRAPAGGAGGHKTSSWSVSAAARRTHPEGDAPNFEGLFTSSMGEVLEGTTTAIAMVRSGVLRCPPLDGRILDSVTRRRVLAIAHVLGLQPEEGPIHLSDLHRADCVLAMNALLPVAACISLDGTPLPTRSAVAESICQHLMRS